MVYCGKPSKGCGQCRARKIRCDQARPGCSQCSRAKRDCPGYRDELSLMFRDESKAVMRKAEAGSSRARHETVERSRTASPDGTQSERVLVDVDPNFLFDFNTDPQHQYPMQQFWQLPLEIQPAPDASMQEAICWFLRSNAVPGFFWMTETVANFLMESGGTSSQRALRSSVVAVASAMLSRVRKIPSLRGAARNEYGSALKLLNTALADIEEAKTNQALGAAVLLAVYEVVTSRAARKIENWTNHICGAAALLDLRGTEQLQSEVGIRLFMHLRYQIIISCIQRDARVPESLIECTKLAMFLRPTEAHGNNLIIIIGKLSNLRADIRANMFSNDHEIISAASAIEAKLIAWLAALSPEFTYTSHMKSPSDSTFERRCRGILPYNNEYHIYPNLWICNTWNQYRCARIIVSDILLSHMNKVSNNSSMTSLSDEFRHHCKALQSTMRRLAVDICRSVPFHLGVHQADIAPYPPLPAPESYVGGMMLLWPLFLAGIVEGRQHALRRWVLQCLNMIGYTMGIDQALALVDIVAVDRGIVPSGSTDGADSAVPGAHNNDRRHSVALVHAPLEEIPASGE